MTAAEAKDVMREVAGEISEEMGWTTGEGGAAGGEGAGRTNAGVRDRHRGGPGGRVLAARGSRGPVRAWRIQRRGQELMGRISLPSSHVRLAHEPHSVVGVLSALTYPKKWTILERGPLTLEPTAGLSNFMSIP